MPTQETTQGLCARASARRIVYGLLYAMALQWSTSSQADEQRAASERRIVYRCLHDNVLTLTDVPCDGERVAIDLNRNLSVAQRVVSPAPSGPRSREAVRTPKKRPRSADPAMAAEQRREQEERCQRLRAQLGTLRSTLRRGYKAATGIQLEERKRQLRAQAQAAKCP